VASLLASLSYLLQLIPRLSIHPTASSPLTIKSSSRHQLLDLPGSAALETAAPMPPSRLPLRHCHQIDTSSQQDDPIVIKYMDARLISDHVWLHAMLMRSSTSEATDNTINEVVNED
jgi:hypothetical protein